MGGRIDRDFKHVVGRDARGLLHALRILLLSEEAKVSTVAQEIAVPSPIVDALYRIETPQTTRYVHIEAQRKWAADVPLRLARYGCAFLMAGQPIPEFFVLLMADKNTPRIIPDCYRVQEGGLHLDVHFRVIKMWELNGEEVRRLNRPDLLPWIVLMNANAETMALTARQIVNSGDREMRARFVMLGLLRYDGNVLSELLRKAEMNIDVSLWEDTWVYQEASAKGLEKGLQKGLAEGRAEGRAEVLHLIQEILSIRFPKLAANASLPSITSFAKLRRLHRQLLLATTQKEAEAALRKAAS